MYRCIYIELTSNYYAGNGTFTRYSGRQVLTLYHRDTLITQNSTVAQFPAEFRENIAMGGARLGSLQLILGVNQELFASSVKINVRGLMDRTGDSRRRIKRNGTVNQ